MSLSEDAPIQGTLPRTLPPNFIEMTHFPEVRAKVRVKVSRTGGLGQTLTNSPKRGSALRLPRRSKLPLGSFGLTYLDVPIGFG